MNLYLVMGTHLPEMRQCLRFLVRSDEEARPAGLLLPEGLAWPDGDDPWASEARYLPLGPSLPLVSEDLSSLWLVVDPQQSPIPQMEWLASLLKAANLPPARIITCVDCAGVEQHPALRVWFDACIYHSDIVLLGNRKTASNAFVRDFQINYERLCYPCLFLLLKGPGNPDQPLEILVPDSRRLTQLFDFGDAEQIPDFPGLIIEASCDLDFEEAEDDPFRPPAEGGKAPQHVPDVHGWIVAVPSP